MCLDQLCDTWRVRSPTKKVKMISTLFTAYAVPFGYVTAVTENENQFECHVCRHQINCLNQNISNNRGECYIFGLRKFLQLV